MALHPTRSNDQDDIDRDAGIIRNTPFSDFENQPTRGGNSTGVRVDRGSGFGRSRTGGRVRSRQPRRPRSPPSRLNRRAIASPERQRQAGRNLVSAPDKVRSIFNPGGAPPRDFAGDRNALLQAPIAGLDEGAVRQEAGRFKQVSDPVTGLSVPDQGDEDTKAAFKRFFDTSFRPGVNSQIPSQRDRNADPTRASFQNRFFPSETLSDLDIGKRRSFRIG